MSPSAYDPSRLENPALQTTPEKEIRVINAPIGEPKLGQVLIHVRRIGICGSDIHFWKHAGIGQLKVVEPLLLGHEAAGEILSVGEGVTKVKVGDRVAIEPQLPCFKCFLCLQGDYNLCDDVAFLGVPPTNGAMQRLLVWSEKFVHKLPEEMSLDQGALCEPLSVGYHGVERADLKLGKPALICGAGPIGLCTLSLAKASGATPIVITDLADERLKFAKELVPDVIPYKINTKLSSFDNAQEIRKLYGTDEADMPPSVMECTGVASSIITGCYVARRSGTVCVIGVSSKELIDGFPFMHLSLAEIDIKFINRYNCSWPPTISLLANKVCNLDKLITHRFKLEDSVEAFKCSLDPSNGNIKVMIEDNYEF